MTPSPNEPSDSAPASGPATESSPSTAVEEIRSDRIAVEVDYDPRVNFAQHENALPVVKALRVRNLGAEPLAGGHLTLWAEPELAARIEEPLGTLPPNSSFRLDAVDLPLHAARLINQTERGRGTLWVEVGTEEEVLLRSAHPLEVLAYGEWAGTASLPEMLAAFVLPNHPEVERLLSAARHRLGERTGDPSLGGYQSRDPARARTIAGAIYEAVAAMDLTYVVPPASFEREGQKIRTPERIVETRMGTCLDLAALFAGALEQAGLHPLIVLLEDHAFVGVWLEEECFVDAAVDEVLRIRKRVDLGSILVFEPTGVTSRPRLGFDAAVGEAERRLGDTGTFLCAIDVQAARRDDIRPLPARGTEPAYHAVEESTEARAEDDESALAEPRTRVERWKRKLLDLSLRNRLLNYRPTRKTVALEATDLTRLEDLLAAGKRFALLPERAAAQDVDTDEETLARELERGHIRTVLAEEDLDRRLVHIYRAARLSLQEGGANILYLALGFLRWYETPSSTVERRAPVLLLPLTMTRRSAAEGTRGYRIELADDDPQINVTLLQKLEADYHLQVRNLEEVLTDESGLDVAAILDRFRGAVRGLERWEVVDDAAIGLFSFTKHLMWVDLDQRTEQLMQSEVVKHLLENPDQPFQPQATFPEPGDLDDTRRPADTYIPLDADSSQMAAIFAAADGHTFVLEGPPGTGKSQTIANLICHSLATGLRVLFVSEKIAALNVVYKRLARIGLAPFCLELHSKKARKRAVLEQLRSALETAGLEAPDDWPRVAERLGAVRTEVNAYVRALHEPRSFGRSAYEGLARLIAHGSAPRVPLDFGAHDELTADDVEKLDLLVANLGVALDEVGDVREHPWRASTLDEWTPALPGKAEAEGRSLAEAADRLIRAASALAEDLGVEPTGLSRRETEGLRDAAALFASSPAPGDALLGMGAFDTLRERAEGWIKTGRKVNEHQAVLGERYTEGLLELNLEVVRRQLERSRQTFWPFSWCRARWPKGQLEGVLRAPRLGKVDALIADVDQAIDWRQRREELAACDAEASKILGPHWRGLATDWDGLEALLAWTARYRTLLARFTPRAEDLPGRWRELAEGGRTLFAEGTPSARHQKELEEALAALEERQGQCQETFALVPELAWGDQDGPAWAPAVRSLAGAWVERKNDLRNWCGFVRTRRAMNEAGLGALLDGVETGRVAPARLQDAYQHSFYSWWVEKLFEAEPLLRRFRSAEQGAHSEEFRALDSDVHRASREAVRARLGEQLPSGRAAAASKSSSSEMGLLHRELMRKRNMPIRKLFERIPNVLSLLKPCLLMSPLSVAQYLSPDFPAFDLVVFDEASQIPPWDAVGAIARGERLVVVGDSKQLPPTNFFQRAEEAEEFADEDDLLEMESILDECIAARLPSLRLGWHYRSRHESLIAFSNHHYYDDKLFTFPSSVHTSPHMGVSWQHVPEGTYDKGKTRTNRVEAQALVDELVRRLQDPDQSRRSYGVVTFSLAQQSLVEDLIEEKRREHADLDRFFSDGVEEPVFVKNLENVQGDERDVILISVGYGPDEKGKLTMNFGPLNREGGERRLNVAVTRSREQVVVFSTLRADQIDLARTQARGARHLKEFLEYAEQGPTALGQALRPPVAATTSSDLQQAVRAGLEDRGWETDEYVGYSGYRIDLGVEDPERPGAYLMAVETDGPIFGAAPTARDRECTRPAVLRYLGWDLARVWSTDWWQAPEEELEKLHRRLEEARLARMAAAQAKAEAEARRREQAEAEPAEGEPEEETQGTDDGDSRSAPSGRIARGVTGKGETAPKSGRPGPDPAVVALGIALGGVPYERARLGPPAGEPREFYEDRAEKKIIRRIDKILAAEAPVALEVVARRLADAWGLKRITRRLEDRVGGLLGQVTTWRLSSSTANFLWRRDQDPQAWQEFRVPGAGEKPLRRARHVPPEEIANAAAALLHEHVSIGLEDLARETARVFGYRRITEKVREPMERGVQLLVERGGAILEDGTVKST